MFVQRAETTEKEMLKPCTEKIFYLRCCCFLYFIKSISMSFKGAWNNREISPTFYIIHHFLCFQHHSISPPLLRDRDKLL